jgi:hypothetical protein
MIEPVLKYINEPLLTFGSNQKAIDPRDGLMLFGPFDQMKIMGVKNIGIIGTKELRGKMLILQDPISPDWKPFSEYL